MEYCWIQDGGKTGLNQMGLLASHCLYSSFTTSQSRLCLFTPFRPVSTVPLVSKSYCSFQGKSVKLILHFSYLDGSDKGIMHDISLYGKNPPFQNCKELTEKAHAWWTSCKWMRIIAFTWIHLVSLCDGKEQVFLTILSTRQVLQTLVLSHLDNCSVLWSGDTKRDLGKLQLAKNRAARLALGCTQKANINNMHVNLSWLKVEERLT